MPPRIAGSIVKAAVRDANVEHSDASSGGISRSTCGPTAAAAASDHREP